MAWLKRVRFEPSPVHGIGVFADEPIKAGEKVWCYDEAMSVGGPGELGGLSPGELSFALHGGYYHAIANKFVWYLDGMQYVNHADPPVANIGIHDWTPLEDDHCAALRDIAPGEEMLEDYEFWSIFKLPESHWMHDFYREFAAEHYNFLYRIHERRIGRRVSA